MAQIIGRRFDGQNNSNLIVFSVASDIVESRDVFDKNLTPKGSSSNMRLLEQRANIEKLKFHPSKPILGSATSINKQPTDKLKKKGSIMGTKDIEKVAVVQPIQPIKHNVQSVDPLQQIGLRTKKAADWLHHEKKQLVSKRDSQTKHREVAKELELKRRQAMHAEAMRRKQLQLELLQAEVAQESEMPFLNTVVRSHDEVMESVSARDQLQETTLVHPQHPHQNHQAVVIRHNTLHQSIVRVSIDSVAVIDHLSEQLTLQTHGRPIVPRLSKNYVNRSSLVIKESAASHHSDSEHDVVAAPAIASKPIGPTHLVLNRSSAAKGDNGDGEDEYDDEDFDMPGESGVAGGVGAITLTESDLKSMLKGPVGDAHTAPAALEGSSNTAGDLISLRSAESVKQRREQGKLYAKQQFSRALQKERAEKLQEEKEVEKRREALRGLQQKVTHINQVREAREQSDNKPPERKPFKYSVEGHDFRNNLPPLDVNDDEFESEFRFERNRLLEEEDVPLRDFLTPGLAATEKERPDKSVASNSKGALSHNSAKQNTADSATNARKSPTTVPMPFKFNGWGQPHNALEKSKSYQVPATAKTPIRNTPSSGAARPAVPRSDKGRPGQRSLSGTKSLHPDGSTRKTKRVKKASRSATHITAHNKAPQGRSLFANDSDYFTEVLELLNRDELPVHQSFPFGDVDQMVGAAAAHNSPPRQPAAKENALHSTHKLFAQQHVALNLPEQQSLDVSRMASRNFSAVSKVISEVDRMCQLLNSQTAELERKLSVRDSMESVDLNTIRAAVAAKLAAKSSLMRTSNNSAFDRPSSEHKTQSAQWDSDLSTPENEFELEQEEEQSGEEEESGESEEGESTEEEVNISMPSGARSSSDKYGRGRNRSGSENNSDSDNGAPSRAARHIHSHVRYDQTDIDDPFLRQQLGLAADRKQIVDKYSKLSGSDQSTEDKYSMLYTRQTDQGVKDADSFMPRASGLRSLQKKHQAFDPFRRPDIVNSRDLTCNDISGARSDLLPSLRNVGELATLLRSAYDVQYSEAEDKPAGAAAQSSDSEGEDDFKAVSLMAKAILRQKQQQLEAQKTSSETKSSTHSSLLVSEKDATVGSAFRPVQVKKEPTASISIQSEHDSADASSDSPRTFWDSMLNRPLQHELNPRGSFASLHLSNDNLLHDMHLSTKNGRNTLSSHQGVYQSPSRHEEHDQVNMSDEYPAEPVASTTFASQSAKPALPVVSGGPVIKHTGAELRLQMQEELRRQDEYFQYTLELAEIEKNHTQTTAREMSHAAKTRSEYELSQLRLHQEIELQKYAYENSLAVSMANSHLAAEQHSMQQKEELLRLHSQLNMQQIQSEYALLLAQAGTVADNLEHNKRLVLLEALLKEDSDRALAAERDRLQSEERERLVAANKEQERLMAIEREQLMATVHRQQQQHQLELSRKAASQSSQRSSLESNRGGGLVKGHQLEADSYGEEYSAVFDEASRSRMDISRDFKDRSAGKKPSIKTVQETSIATEISSRYSSESDESEVAEELASEKSSSEEESEYSEDEAEVSEEMQQSAVQSVRPTAKPELAVAEESIVEEAEESKDYSVDDQSDIEEELSVVRSPAKQNTLHNRYAAQISDDEVSEQQPEEDSEPSIQEENYSVEEEESFSQHYSADDYSDTFESKMSVASSLPPSAKKGASGSRKNIPPEDTAEELAKMKALLAEASSSLSGDESAGHDLGAEQLNHILEQYKAEMELRLRAQEKTHKLRVEFLKSKHTQRVEALESLAHDKSITADQLAEEQQRVEEAFAEERAVLEREKWALNARSYKELRKFKQLKRELTLYQSNKLSEGTAIADEMRASILGNLRASQASAGRASIEEESDESQSSSEDFRRKKAPKSFHAFETKSVAVEKKSEPKVDYSYQEDTFEEESVREASELRFLQSKAQSLVDNDDVSEDMEAENSLEAVPEEDSTAEDSIPEEDEEDSPMSSYEVSESDQEDKEAADGQSRQYADFEVSVEEAEAVDEEYSQMFVEESLRPDSSHISAAGKLEQSMVSQSYMGDDFEVEDSHVLESSPGKVAHKPVLSGTQEEKQEEDASVAEEISEEMEEQSGDEDEFNRTAHSAQYQSDFEATATSVAQLVPGAAAKSVEESYANDFDEEPAAQAESVESELVNQVSPAAVALSVAKELDESSEEIEEIEESFGHSDDEEQGSPSERHLVEPQTKDGEVEASNLYSEEEFEADGYDEEQEEDKPPAKASSVPPEARVESPLVDDAVEELEEASQSQSHHDLNLVKPATPSREDLESSLANHLVRIQQINSKMREKTAQETGAVHVKPELSTSTATSPVSVGSKERVEGQNDFEQEAVEYDEGFDDYDSQDGFEEPDVDAVQQHSPPPAVVLPVEKQQNESDVSDIEEDIEEDLDDGAAENDDQLEEASPLQPLTLQTGHFNSAGAETEAVPSLSRDASRETEYSGRSRVGSSDSFSSGALEESKEFELDLKGKKSLLFAPHISPGVKDRSGFSAGIASADDSKMFFDKEKQRWVGGEDVSLDGFDESADEFGSPMSTKRKEHSPNSRPAAFLMPEHKVHSLPEFPDELSDEEYQDDTEEPDPEGDKQEHDGSASVLESAVHLSNKPSTSPDDAEVEEEVEEIFEEVEDEDEVVAASRGVDDSTLSVVSEDNSPLPETSPLSPLHEESAQKSTAQSSDSDNTVQWATQSQQGVSSSAVIVTTPVITPVESEIAVVEKSFAEDSFLDESLGEGSEENAESVEPIASRVVADVSALESSGDVSLGAILDDIDHLSNKEKSSSAALLSSAAELSSDDTEEGDLSDIDASYDLIEDNLFVTAASSEASVAAVSTSTSTSPQASKESVEAQVDDVTDALLGRLLQESLSDLPADFDLAGLLQGNSLAERVNTEGNFDAASDGSVLEDSSDSTDSRKIMQFVEQKAEQFLSKFENKNSSNTSGTSSLASLASLKSMPSLVTPQQHKPKHSGKHFGHHHSSGSGSGSSDEEDDLYSFDDALSSALGVDDRSPVKSHPDISDVPKLLAEKAHHKVDIIESLTNTEATNELRVQDILHNTESFLDALFDDMAQGSDVQLVQHLADPAHEGPFLRDEYRQYAVEGIAAGGANLHREAILDRINEICLELHSLKHFPASQIGTTSFPQRLMAQSLPLDGSAVHRFVKRHILEDQHTLVKLLKGEKGVHELLNVTAIDSFREETHAAIQDCSDQIADALLVRLLIDTVRAAGREFDLAKYLTIRA